MVRGGLTGCGGSPIWANVAISQGKRLAVCEHIDASATVSRYDGKWKINSGWKGQFDDLIRGVFISPPVSQRDA